MKKLFKIILGVVISLICLFVIIVGGLNLAKYLIYPEYYEIRENVVTNEGLGSGYVPQGLTKFSYDDKDYFITSGYMGNGDPSRLYVIGDKNSAYVNVLDENGELLNSHFGGVQVFANYIFVSADNNIFVLNLDSVMSSLIKEEGDNIAKETIYQVEVVNTVELRVAASFIYINKENGKLYVGEFNNGKEYITNHEEKVNDGNDTYYAYVDVYNSNNIINGHGHVLHTYAIRDKVQGFAISGDEIVLSTSYGLASSYFYVYDIPLEYDDAEDKIYYLDDRYLKREIKAPAMAEGLEYDAETDLYYTLFESACNKYIFGKFFFANKIVSLNIE